MDNDKSNEKQAKEYEAIQKKHNSKFRKIARKFAGFLKKGFPSRWWSWKKDSYKGHKF